MSIATFRSRVRARESLVGTFLKTPAYELIEVLAPSGLDFLCLDAEHAPWDRARMDACLALGRALDFPLLVRVSDTAPKEILQALDSGAVGIVVPHVTSGAVAAEIAKVSRFGPGGRGFAGSTRWAGYATRPMAEVLAQGDETVVIAQIEDPEAVENATEIAGAEGIDGVFLGPADLSVGYGRTDQNGPELAAAFDIVNAASRGAGIGFATFATGPDHAAQIAPKGPHMFFVSSEQGWMRAGATAAAKEIKG